MKLLDELNAEQRRAATAGDGPVMIVAGPGTGKTKTLVARIGHLAAADRARPEQVLALTFTNKAAGELEERIRAAVGLGVRVGTFHGLCRQILSEAGDWPEREFVSETDRLAVLRGLRRPAELKGLAVREVGLAVSRLKNGAETAGGAVGALTAAYNAAMGGAGLAGF